MQVRLPFLVALMFPPSFLALSANDPSSFFISERGPHSRVWKKETIVQSESGARTNVASYTELATGLHYWDGTQWQESRDEIEVVADGAAATHGQHTVHWNANLNTLGAVSLTTPDGQLMRSHVLGLAYTSESGQSVFIAQIQNSDGILLPPNEIVYPAALGLAADVRYTYTKAGCEQDILIREKASFAR